MTEDPYRLDGNQINDDALVGDDLEISATHDMGDDLDEYEGLETGMNMPAGAAKRFKPVSALLALMLVIFVAGAGYIAYQMFVVDVGPLAPARPPMAMAPQAPLAPQDMTAMPQDDEMALPPGIEAQDDIMASALPPLEGETDGLPPMVDNADPVQDAIAPVDATTADTDAGAPVVAEGETPVADSVENAALPLQDENTADVVAVDAVDNAASDATLAMPPVEQLEAADKNAQNAQEAAPVQAVQPAVPAAFADAVQKAELRKNREGEMSGILSDDPANTTDSNTLKPIDPAKPVATAAVAAAPASRKTKTLEQVEEILQATGLADNKPDNKPAPPVEVTPKARQVIVVKRAYSAATPQAAIAAGDRVLNARQYDTAAEIFDQQLKANPSDPLALAGKALALQKSGQHIEAMNTYDRLLALNPRDVEALTNYLGLLQEQDPQQALSRLQNLATQYPQNAAVAGQLAMAYARMMDTPNALRYFQTAAALDPTNATYPFNLGVLYDRLGTTHKARAEYSKAFGLVRQYPDRANVSLETIRQRLTSLPN